MIRRRGRGNGKDAPELQLPRPEPVLRWRIGCSWSPDSRRNPGGESRRRELGPPADDGGDGDAAGKSRAGLLHLPSDRLPPASDGHVGCSEDPGPSVAALRWDEAGLLTHPQAAALAGSDIAGAALDDAGSTDGSLCRGSSRSPLAPAAICAGADSAFCVVATTQRSEGPQRPAAVGNGEVRWFWASLR